MVISEPKQKVRQALLDAGVEESRANHLTMHNPDKFLFQDLIDIAKFLGIPYDYQWRLLHDVAMELEKKRVRENKPYHPHYSYEDVCDEWALSTDPQIVFEHKSETRKSRISLRPKDDKQREIVEIL